MRGIFGILRFGVDYPSLSGRYLGLCGEAWRSTTRNQSINLYNNKEPINQSVQQQGTNQSICATTRNQSINLCNNKEPINQFVQQQGTNQSICATTRNQSFNQSVHTATVMICQLPMSMYCVNILTESNRVRSRHNYKCNSTRVKNSQQVCVLEPWIIYILEKDLKIDCWISSRRTLVYSMYIHVCIDWLIDWIEFYAVSAIFQPWNGSYTAE